MPVPDGIQEDLAKEALEQMGIKELPLAVVNARSNRDLSGLRILQRRALRKIGAPLAFYSRVKYGGNRTASNG